MNAEKDIIVLVPKHIFIEANKLREFGMYKDAINLINANKMDFVIYAEKEIDIKMKNIMISTRGEK